MNITQIGNPLVLLAIATCVALFVVFFRYLRRFEAFQEWLTDQELLLSFKIVAILVMFIMLFLVNNAREIPADAFFYGRF